MRWEADGRPSTGLRQGTAAGLPEERVSGLLEPWDPPVMQRQIEEGSVVRSCPARAESPFARLWRLLLNI